MNVPEPIAAEDSVNASLPPGTQEIRGVPESAFSGPIRERVPLSLDASSPVSGVGGGMVAGVADLIGKGFAERALAIRATNDVIALGNAYIQSSPLCAGQCASITNVVGAYTSLVDATFTGNYSTAVRDAAISGALGSVNNTVGAAYSAGSHLNSMGSR